VRGLPALHQEKDAKGNPRARVSIDPRAAADSLLTPTLHVVVPILEAWRQVATDGLNNRGDHALAAGGSVRRRRGRCAARRRRRAAGVAPSAVELLISAPLPSDAAELPSFIKQSTVIPIESPMNLHQATAYVCCVKEDAPMATKLFLLAASVVLVVLQVRVLRAIGEELGFTSGSNGAGRCTSNYDCVGDAGGGLKGRKYCEFWHIVDADGMHRRWNDVVTANETRRSIYRHTDHDGNANPYDVHQAFASQLGTCRPCSFNYRVVTDKTANDTVVVRDGVSSCTDSEKKTLVGCTMLAWEAVCRRPSCPPFCICASESVGPEVHELHDVHEL